MLNEFDQLEVHQWIEHIDSLSPLEAGALIGFLEHNPRIRPDDVPWKDVVGEGKCHRASVFLHKHFDAIAEAYCTWARGSKGDLTTDGALTFLPALIAVGVNASAGAGVAILAFMIKFGMRRICPYFIVEKLEGSGRYAIFPSLSDMDSEEPQRGSGYAWVKYRPPVLLLVSDPRYEDDRHQIGVQSNGWAKITFKADNTSLKENILNHARPGAFQSFEIKDPRSGMVVGSISLDKDLPPESWPTPIEGDKLAMKVTYSSLTIDGRTPEPLFIS